MTLYNPAIFIKKVRNLQDPAEIERYCEELKQQLGFHNPGKLEHKLKKATAYAKEFRALTPEQLTPTNSYQRKIKRGIETRHLYFKYMGYDDVDYDAVNDKSIKMERLTNQREVDVDRYLEIGLRLLQSNNVWEIATGLIVMSGRRPTEILYSGDFTIKKTSKPDYLQTDYAIYFSGQLKQKDSQHSDEFWIGTLVSAREFLKIFQKFRAFPQMREHHIQAEKMKAEGQTDEQIHRFFNNKLQSITRVINKNFDWLLKNDGEEEITEIGKCSKLRAIYSRLITERDCPKSINQILFAAWMCGHITDTTKLKDKDLIHITTTLSYQSFYPSTQEIPYLTIEGEKTVSIRASESFRSELNQLAEQWGLNQQQALDALLEEYNQLKAGQTEKPKTFRRPDKPEDIKGEDLFEKGIRFVGSAQEKVRRSYLAVTSYNDSVPSDRLAVTNQVLRQLSGSNGNDVSKWMKEHQDEIISHNAKYSMNTRENDLTTYYNKRYGAGKIEEIVEVIRQNYLE